MPDNYIFLGIDPSIKNTGLCILKIINNSIIISLYDISNYTKIPKDKIKRYTVISNSVKNILATEIGSLDNFNLFIGYEDYSYHSTNKSFSLGELGGCLKTTIISYQETNANHILQSELLLVPPTKLKQFATGTGTATKSMMINAFLNTVNLNLLNHTNKNSIAILYNSNAITESTNFTNNTIGVTDDCADAYFLAEFSYINYVSNNSSSPDSSTRYTVAHLRNKVNVVVPTDPLFL
jgi:Holliday junction resolvasome RuvABC endonuclease subunit